MVRHADTSPKNRRCADSRTPLPTPGFEHASRLFSRSIAGEITETDLDAIAAWPVEELSILFAAADQVRRHVHADTVRPCSLLNIKSGNCPEDCAFCAQSAHSAAVIDEHDLVSGEAIEANFRAAIARGLEFCVVSAGRRLSRDEVVSIAGALKAVGHPSHASLGLLDEEELSVLRDAGVVCYNHNLETSRRHFPKICTTHAYDDRIATVRKAKSAGLHVCCGGIFGMGETWEDRRDLCLELRALDVDTIPLNFFNPVPGTRLDAPRESALEFLKIVALFRLAHPRATIKVCGGREYHLGALQPLIFFAGANGYVSGNYLTTSGQGLDADDRMIAALGLRKEELHHEAAKIAKVREGD